MKTLNTPLVSQEYRDEVAVKGFDVYNTKLRDLLESDHNNEYVAIHVDTQDYAVGRSMAAAIRAIRSRHGADGRLIGIKIGHEPEFGLAARVIAAQQQAAAAK